MKKTIFVLITLLLLSSSLVLAHGEEINNKNTLGGGNMVCGMVGTGMWNWGLYGIVYFIVMSFVFSVIFWLTHNWLVKHKKKK